MESRFAPEEATHPEFSPWHTRTVATKQQQAGRLAAKRRLDEEHAQRVPTHAETLANERDVLSRHRTAVAKVDQLALQQKQVGDELDRDLGGLLQQGSALDVIEQRQSETGFLANLTRRFTARSELLARRSIAEKLLHRYEVVNARLTEASAFVDELRLTSLELQEEVDRLHGELARSTEEEVRLAERIDAIEEELDSIAEQPDAAQRIDKLMFEERVAATDVALWTANARIARQGLKPARLLRDHVLQLHGDVARYVGNARGIVREAGHRIQALGTAADAALVVSELRSSLEDLQQTMAATEGYLRSTQDLYVRVLPELTANLEAHYADQSVSLHTLAPVLSREAARERAEQAHREAAQAELAQLLGEDVAG